MNILSEPLVNYDILFSFLISFFQNRDIQFIKKNCDSQFIQNRAALVYMLLLLNYKLKVQLICPAIILILNNYCITDGLRG